MPPNEPYNAQTPVSRRNRVPSCGPFYRPSCAVAAGTSEVRTHGSATAPRGALVTSVHGVDEIVDGGAHRAAHLMHKSAEGVASTTSRRSSAHPPSVDADNHLSVLRASTRSTSGEGLVITQSAHRLSAAGSLGTLCIRCAARCAPRGHLKLPLSPDPIDSDEERPRCASLESLGA